MPHLPFTARAGLLALAVAVAAGCASVPSQPARQAQEQPMVQLQDPNKTPREKWSDAMVILHGDMGITWQRDIPRELIDNAALQATQRRGENTGSTIETGGVAVGAAGYMAPPTGFNAAGALGAGLALGFLTAPPAPGPAQLAQVAAWVPSHLAENMDQAIELAMSTYGAARKQVFQKTVGVDLKASRYPAGSDPSLLYSGFIDIAKRKPVPPIDKVVSAPSFLSPGKYYGPIFFYGSPLQFQRDNHHNKTKNPESMLKLSKVLPEWFVLYSPGVRPQRGFAGEAPLLFSKGQAMPFIGK